MRWWQWAIPLTLGAGVELYRRWRKAHRAPVVHIDQDDPAMNDAIAQARTTLPAFVATLRDPRPGHRDFSIKAFFPEIGEHIWVAELTHAEGAFSGTLGNEPVGPTTLRLGDRVSISEALVTDWKYIQHDVLVGGYSIRVLRSRMDDESRKALDAQLDFRIL
jgi:uncharacterized protein YegJ (DUF2314 family)